MRERELKRLWTLVGQLTLAERAKLRETLFRQSSPAEVVSVIEGGAGEQRSCPHCRSERVVRHGQVDGLQRYRCRGCGKTFNALSGTPMARLRHKDKWLAQSEVLNQGLSIHAAARQLQVAPSTAFRWRHRFLAQAQAIKAKVLLGIAEADETFVLRSHKGEHGLQRKGRRRGGKSSTRGTSDDHVPVLVARDRSGAGTDFILHRADKAQLTAVLSTVLASDTVLCTDGSSAMAAAARNIGVEHHALNMTSGSRVQGPWHIQNVNAYHARFKAWMQRFRGVATKYLASYLGWFRAKDRFGSKALEPTQWLTLAVRPKPYP